MGGWKSSGSESSFQNSNAVLPPIITEQTGITADVETADMNSENVESNQRSTEEEVLNKEDDLDNVFANNTLPSTTLDTLQNTRPTDPTIHTRSDELESQSDVKP